MAFDKTVLTERLCIWQNAMETYTVPRWEDFPDLPLYMDQVIMLLNQYLQPVPSDQKSEHILTPAMINNYVKLKVVPAPVKKRYNKIHLAYLMMVCTLKKTINISDIPHLLPPFMEEETVHEIYNAFVDIFHHSVSLYKNHVQNMTSSMNEEDPKALLHLIMHLTVAANLFSDLTAHLAVPGQHASSSPNPKAEE